MEGQMDNRKYQIAVKIKEKKHEIDYIATKADPIRKLITKWESRLTKCTKTEQLKKLKIYLNLVSIQHIRNTYIQDWKKQGWTSTKKIQRMHVHQFMAYCNPPEVVKSITYIVLCLLKQKVLPYDKYRMSDFMKEFSGFHMNEVFDSISGEQIPGPVIRVCREKLRKPEQGWFNNDVKTSMRRVSYGAQQLYDLVIEVLTAQEKIVDSNKLYQSTLLEKQNTKLESEIKALKPDLFRFEKYVNYYRKKLSQIEEPLNLKRNQLSVLLQSQNLSQPIND